MNKELNELHETAKKSRPSLSKQEIIVYAIKNYLENPEWNSDVNLESEKKTNFYIIVPTELNETFLNILENARKKGIVNFCLKNHHITLTLTRLINCRDLSGI